MLKHPAIDAAVVVLREDVRGLQRLVAYVKSEDSHPDTPLTDAIRQFLAERLPEYMVPPVFVMLQAMPLTSSGKVDRKALPAPDTSAETKRGEYVAPRNPKEEVLAAIWAELLGLERVSINDSFFELGGDSILSIQAIARAKRNGLQLTPIQLFEQQTIARLAPLAEGERLAVTEQGPITGPLALTPIQRAFFQRPWRNIHHFNQAVLFEVSHGVNPQKLASAFEALLAHHDGLRLRFQQQGQSWSARFSEPETQVAFETRTCSPEDAARWDDFLQPHLLEVQTGLHLEKGPLVKALLFQVSGDASETATGIPGRLFIAIHHLVVDGVSWRIFLEDLQTAYEQLRLGGPIQLPAKTTSIKTWSLRLEALAQSGALDAEETDWLAMAPEVAASIPGNRETNGEQNTVGSSKTLTMTLSKTRTKQLLQDVHKAYHTRIDDLLLSALTLTFCGDLNLPHLWLDVEGHGRLGLFEDVDLSRTLGWFTAVFPVKLTHSESGNSALPNLIKSVKERLRTLPRQGIGYGILRYLGKGEPGPLAGLPEREIIFNYLGQFDQTTAGSDWLNPLDGPTGPPLDAAELRQHLLEIDAVIVRDRLQIRWIFSTAFHREKTVAHWMELLTANLERLVEHCLSPQTGGFTPSDFPMAGLNQEQLDQLLPAPGDVEDIYPLSPMQEGMLYHILYDKNPASYSMQISYQLVGDLNVPALQQSWQEMVNRHPALRSSFYWDDLPSPRQIVRKKVVLPWNFKDWQKHSQADQKKAFETFLAKDRERGFDPQLAPLMRFTLITLAANRFQLVWTHNHLLFDGWSTPIILKEVFTRYQGLCNNWEQSLPDPQPYKRYIQWLGLQDRSRAETYWRQVLQGFQSATKIAYIRPRGSTASTSRQEAEFRFSEALTANLNRFAKEQKLTLNTLMRGAWAFLLSRYSGTKDVVFGATVAGRPADLDKVEAIVGLFINTLPVRVQLKDERSLIPWLEEIQSQQAASDEMAFAPLVEIQQWSDAPRDEALFETNLVFENYPLNRVLAASVVEASSADSGRLQVRKPLGSGQPHFPLTVRTTPEVELHLSFIFDPDSVASQTLQTMFGHFRTLLEEIVSNPHRQLGALDYLDPHEKKRLTVEFNETETPFPACRSIPSLFETCCAKVPEHTALVAVSSQGTKELSFAQLNSRANVLARQLLKRAVGPGDVVPLAFQRDEDFVVALLAVLKRGAAYLPLDAKQPLQRLQTIVAQAAAPVLLTHKALNLPELGVEALFLEDLPATPETDGLENPSPEGDPNHPVYLIFTSGSTGRPKGVTVTQENLWQYLHGLKLRLDLGAGESYALVSSLAADLGHTTLFPSLCFGGTLHLLDEDTIADPMSFGEYFQGAAIDNLKITPSHLAVLGNQPQPECVLPRKRLILGGEATPWPLVKTIRGLVPQLSIYNHYGPSETTVGVVMGPIPESDTVPVPPLGKPLPNQQVYIVDQRLQPLPEGIPGELVVGGSGVSQGYCGQPRETATRFLPDPFSKNSGSRIYATGDRARFLKGGVIEFLGRLDRQVKIRGFRVELGEIETALVTHDWVKGAVAMVHPVKGEPHITAYVQTAAKASEQEIRQTLVSHLDDRIPGYMRPGTFFLLASLPLTANGKLDLKALPVPGQTEAGAKREHMAPANDTETQLAKIWKEELKLERVGVLDDFFDLGGHSLIAAVILLRIRKTFDVRLLPADIFEQPTIRGLASRIHLIQIETSQSEDVASALGELANLSPREIQEMLAREEDTNE